MEEGLQKSRSLAGKIKVIMFVNEKESILDKTAADMTELIYRIRNCLRCMCANCIKIGDECDCAGCLYGSYVSECDSNIEIRSVNTGVCEYNGLEIRKTAYNRAAKELTMTMIDGNGIESTATISLSG